MSKVISCLLTRSYKAGYIHSGIYNGVEEYQWQLSDEKTGKTHLGNTRSLHAAKIAITKKMKELSKD